MHMLDMCKFRETDPGEYNTRHIYWQTSAYFVAKLGTFQCICSNFIFKQMSDNKKAHYVHRSSW